MHADAAIHPRDDTWTTEGLGRYLKHFRGPWLPDGAQGLPQLHVEVHGARLRRGGVPVGDVDGGESHARRGSCAWRLHVKRPARVAAKDLHLGRHASSQSPLSSRSKGRMLLDRPQMAQRSRSIASAALAPPRVFMPHPCQAQSSMTRQEHNGHRAGLRRWAGFLLKYTWSMVWLAPVSRSSPGLSADRMIMGTPL